MDNPEDTSDAHGRDRIFAIIYHPRKPLKELKVIARIRAKEAKGKEKARDDDDHHNAQSSSTQGHSDEGTGNNTNHNADPQDFQEITAESLQDFQAFLDHDISREPPDKNIRTEFGPNGVFLSSEWHLHGEDEQFVIAMPTQNRNSVEKTLRHPVRPPPLRFALVFHTRPLTEEEKVRLFDVVKRLRTAWNPAKRRPREGRIQLLEWTSMVEEESSFPPSEEIADDTGPSLSELISGGIARLFRR